ncbi:TPA: hypothetical protein ACH3X1_009311 [Trebouxia sp. C0004]
MADTNVKRKSTRPSKPTSRSPGTPGSGNSNCRYDSSLGLLTKKFVHLVEAAPDGVLDLNKAADALAVQKRRIYDITNVLEGIGLIEKKLKNNIQWKGGSSADAADNLPEQAALRQEISNLQEDEQNLKRHITALEDSIKDMTEDAANSARLYVTDEDIAKLPCTANDTVFAVKAPQGTTLEVPDPDDGLETGQRRYRIVLKSNCDTPIDVWLVSGHHQQKHQEDEEVPMDHPHAGMAAVHVKHEGDPMAGPPNPVAAHLDGHLGMDASPPFLRVQHNEPDPDTWFQHSEPPALGIAEYFEHEHGMM